MREQLRKAGQYLLDKDRQYAEAVGKHIDPNKQPIAEMTRAVPIGDIFRNPMQADSQVEKLMGVGMDAAVLSANVASRYALPAGGVTLAGAAIIDLTAQFGGGADFPEEQQLTLQ